MPSPSGPAGPRPASWWYALRRTCREFVEDDLLDGAAALTYFAVVSVFPALLAVLALASIVGEGRPAAAGLLDVLRVVLPVASVTALQAPIDGFASPSDAPWLLGGGAMLAIWTASGYVSAFARAMNRIWEVEEGRPWWRRRLAQLGVTAGILLLSAVALTAAVASDPVTLSVATATATGLGSGFVVAVGALRWPLLAAAVVLLLVLLYGAAPNVRRPRIRLLGAGGLAALLLIAAASAGFAVYVNRYSHYDRSYGSLAGVVVLLIWLFLVNLAVLFGAEFDAELERVRELQAGDRAAARRILVQPRSTAAIPGRRDAVEREVAEGETLSRAAPRSTCR